MCMYKQDLASNNLQEMICCKTQPTCQLFLSHEEKIIYSLKLNLVYKKWLFISSYVKQFIQS